VNAQVISISRNFPLPHAPWQIVSGAQRRLEADREIYLQDEEADEVFLLVSGVVRTTRLDRDGRRQIGGFYYPGDVFGLESGDLHRYSAEALTECEVLAVRRSSLRRGGDGVADVERAIWDGTIRELERTQEHLLLLGRKTACEKVAAFLSDLAARSGQEITDLPMGRQDMADYLGLTIETVSRMISQLQSEGVVEFLGCRRFRLRNAVGLRRLAAA